LNRIKYLLRKLHNLICEYYSLIRFGCIIKCKEDLYSCQRIYTSIVLQGLSGLKQEILELGKMYLSDFGKYTLLIFICFV